MELDICAAAGVATDVSDEHKVLDSAYKYELSYETSVTAESLNSAGEFRNALWVVGVTVVPTCAHGDGAAEATIKAGVKSGVVSCAWESTNGHVAVILGIGEVGDRDRCVGDPRTTCSGLDVTVDEAEGCTNVRVEEVKKNLVLVVIDAVQLDNCVAVAVR